MKEKERKEGPKVLHVTQAPPPITPLSGTGGWTSRHPKRTQIPPNPPAYFPLDLWPKTCVILAEAAKKFPDRKHQMPELCKHYISEMTPLFCRAVEAGTMKAGAALQEGLGGMQDLLRSLLVYNDDGPHSGFGGLSNEAYQIYQEVRNSEEWRKLARAIAEAQGEAQSPSAQNSPKTAQSVRGKSVIAARADRRKSFVGPILETKGFSVHDWAKQADVDFHTANGYLKGKTSPHPSTRKKLADAVGLKAEELPS